MRFVPDTPVNDASDDALGFREFVDLIQRSIFNTETPFVYGILGDWGIGKTSILRLLHTKIEDASPTPDGDVFVPIWFNAWEYENESNLIYPLLHAIRADYKTRVANPAEMRTFLQHFRDVAAASVLLSMDLSVQAVTKELTGEALKFKDITEQLEAIKKHTDTVETVLAEWTDTVGKIKTAFSDLLDTYAIDLARGQAFGADGVQFVILIDDLDRCLPETVIRVLENLKNHLTVSRCVFVLALNARIVYQGISVKYGGATVDGREYLEKFLNYSFYVPEPTPQSVRKFVQDRIARLVPDADQQMHYVDYFRQFGAILEDSRFVNPRKIKRILNRLLLFIAKYEQVTTNVQLRQFNLSEYPTPNLVRLITMAEYFPTLFQLFLYDPKKAEAARKRLTFNASDFDAAQFEHDFGVPITANLPQLAAVSRLFELQEARDQTKPSLVEQAQAVYSITRLV